ncbi:hypothetical protein BJ546DRAFT_1075908 [Cryomyces antarcticus]
MASRLLVPATRTLARNILTPSTALRASRSFTTSQRLMEVPVGALPVRRPVGAFRGGLLGFLLGATTSGAGIYYYILEDYKVSNELLTEDIYALQAAVSRIENYVHVLEDKVTVQQQGGKK